MTRLPEITLNELIQSMAARGSASPAARWSCTALATAVARAADIDERTGQRFAIRMAKHYRVRAGDDEDIKASVARGGVSLASRLCLGAATRVLDDEDPGLATALGLPSALHTAWPVRREAPLDVNALCALRRRTAVLMAGHPLRDCIDAVTGLSRVSAGDRAAVHARVCAHAMPVLIRRGQHRALGHALIDLRGDLLRQFAARGGRDIDG